MKYIAGRVPLGIEEPLGGQLKRAYKDFNRGIDDEDIEIEYDGENDVQPASLPDANLYTSEIRWGGKNQNRHMVALDVDVPVQVFPSRKPGHSHLYIEKPVEQTHLFLLLNLLAQMGIVEEGYANASVERGFTALRVPWLPKRKVNRKKGGLLTWREKQALEEKQDVAEAEAMARIDHDFNQFMKGREILVDA